MKQAKREIVILDGTKAEAITPAILSVSRATDVPAFYSDWFFNRLERGYCRWRNPFNGTDIYVSFENVRFIVFWSKNPTPLIPYISRLQEHGINCYIQYTLNDYEDERLEPGVPPLRHRIDTFKCLAKMPGVGAVVWRFDPLILTDKICIDDLLRKIERIGNQLTGYTEKLVFSFADIAAYRKVSGNLTSHGINYKEWTETEMLDFARQLSELNHRNGWNFRLATCAEKIDLGERHRPIQHLSSWLSLLLRHDCALNKFLYFLRVTPPPKKKKCHMLKLKTLQFCHVLSIFVGWGLN